MNCLHCEKENVVKNGSRRHGRQRFLCRECHRTFGEKDGRRVCADLQAQARRLDLEGVGFRGIERLLGVSHVSAMNWVKARAQALPPLPGVDPAEVEWVECDELCTFIGEKSLLLALDDRSTQTAQNLLRNYRAAIT